MKTELAEVIGLGIHELIHQEHHPDAVMFWQVKTVKGAGVARWLVDLFQHGSFEVRDGITVHVGNNLNIQMRRSDKSVEIDFSPPPTIKASLWGLGNYNIKLEGATIYQHELRMILGGFKDLTIAIED